MLNLMHMAVQAKPHGPAISWPGALMALSTNVQGHFPMNINTGWTASPDNASWGPPPVLQ